MGSVDCASCGWGTVAASLGCSAQDWRHCQSSGRRDSVAAVMPSLSTPDGRALAWEESGTGSPLLCHPGGPGMSARCFGGLPELAAERTLLLLDPRGTGAS